MLHNSGGDHKCLFQSIGALDVIRQKTIMVGQDMKRKVCGQFPEFCYKAYDHEDYARQFIDNGSFRLNCRYYCQNMENASRRDPTEGAGLTKEPGIITAGWVSPNPAEKTIWTREQGYQEHHTELGNPIFLFCTSLPDANLDYMKEKFGPYIVRIDNPRQLAEDTNDYFISNRQKFLIEGSRVVYNKGQKLARELTDSERTDLSYSQKPPEFFGDCEFRIVAIGLNVGQCKPECRFLDGERKQECEFIDVNLGKRLKYLSLLS